MGKGATVMSEYERQNRDLAYEPTAQEVGSDLGTRSDKTPEEIEREIGQTRNRLSRDIDELGHKLSPQNLKEEAKSAIKDAAQGAVSNVGEQARRTGSRLVEVIRENPLPVIAVGAGVTWLLTQRNRSEISGNRMARYAYTGPERRQGESWQSGSGIRGRVGSTVSGVKDSVSEATSGVKDSVSEAASSVAERAGELKERAGARMGELGGEARRQTRRIKTNLQHTAEEKPLALAIGAAVVGLALGMLLPGTQREDELMGPSRDQLVDRAERTAERVKYAAADAGRELKETVRTEIEEHKPEVKQVVQEASQTVKDQVKESAKRVKKEAKDAAKESGGNPRSTA
jgi:gas vesicle protein